MRLKPKTVRRLTLVAVVGCVLLIAAFSLVYVRKWQGERMIARYRAEALAAHQQKEYSRTILNAGSYLKRGDQRDAEILLAYAEARANLEEPKHTHLRDAAGFYERYLEVRPDDVATKQVLLELYNTCGFFAEAAELARKGMRPADLSQTSEADLPVLEQEAIALVYSKRYGPELSAILDRILALDPLSVRGAILKVEAIGQRDPQGSRAAAARQWADSYLDAHPEEPVALLAAATARFLSGNRAEAGDIINLLSRAAKLDPRTGARTAPATYSDPVLATQITVMLDRLGAHDYALEVLRDADSRISTPEIKNAIVRRLHQESAHEELEMRTRGIDPADPTSDPVVLGLRALSLFALGRADEAGAIAAALEKREGDYRVTSWAKALGLAPVGGGEDHAKRISELRQLTRDNPNEPVLQMWLGDSLAALGRTEEARTAWREAGKIPQGAAWAAPRVRMAESFLAEGRLDEARAAIDEASRLAFNRALVLVVRFEIQAARMQKGLTSESPAALLGQLEAIEASIAGMPASESLRALSERLLVPKVIFLARSNNVQLATAEALKALESGEPLRPETISRLALASSIEGLGLEEAIARQSAAGAQTPAAVLFVRGIELSMAGKAEEAKAVFHREIEAHPSSPQPMVAYAQFLERAQDAGALQAWKDVAEKFPQSLMVQRACLGSEAIAADRAFVDQTIGRYQPLAGLDAGTDDVVIRMARARTLVHGTPTVRDRDSAVALLSAVIAQAPTVAEPKRLLAKALTITGPGISPDLPRATQALNDAITLEPGSSSVAIELARLQQLQGLFDRARDHLVRIATSKSEAIDYRFRAAEMLIAQGDTGSAAFSALSGIAAALGAETPAQVLVPLAEIYEARREHTKATEIYERLAAGLAKDAETIYMTARHFALNGNQERAQHLMTELDAVKLPDGKPLPESTKDLMRARLAAELNLVDEAKAFFEEAVAAAPATADIWRQYAGMHLRRGDYKGAVEITNRGLGHNPQDLTLTVLKTQSELFQSGADDPDLGPLVQLLASIPSPGNPGEIIAAVRDLRAQGELESVDSLTRVADRYPGSMALQLYIAQRMMPLDTVRAAAIVNRTMAANPADPRPAQFAAELYMALRRWPDVIGAAEVWRDRDASRSVEPDIAIAQARLELRQYSAGIAVLEPRLAAAIAEPDSTLSMGVMNIYARLMIGSGKETEAFNRLMPAFRASREARLRVGMDNAGTSLPSFESSRRWLDQLAALGDPKSTEDQLATATVLAMLASRHPDKFQELLNEAATILGRLAAAPELATAAVFESLGIVRHRLSDTIGAAEAYRTSIELDPRRAAALNNLAYLQMETDLDGALDLARRAVASREPPDPAHLDTLASIHYRRAQRAGSNSREEYRAAADAYMQAWRLSSVDLNTLRNAAGCAIKGRDFDTAIVALESMIRLTSGPGQSDRTLNAQCRNNLAAVLLMRGKGGTDVERARELAASAVAIQETPGFLDTLGWSQVAAGRLQEAEAAFRKAIGADANLVSSIVGLATALAGGTEAQRQEARGLLEGLDPAKVDEGMKDQLGDEDLKPRLDRARSLLASAAR